MTCPICEGASVGNRLCGKHRWEKDHPQAAERRRKRENNLCIVDGCENPRYVRAKCKVHHQEMPSQTPEAVRTRNRSWLASLKLGGEARQKVKRANDTARKRCLEATLTEEQVADLISATPSCHYCGTTLKRHNRELDHIHPIAEGGTSTLDNVRIICKNCNRAKGQQSESAFLRWLDQIFVFRSINK